MKIAMVTPRFDTVAGGGEISVRLLVEQLRKLGHKVDVFSDIPYRLMKVMLESRKDDYDLFHCYNMTYLPILGWLSKKYNVKTIGTLNGITFSRSMSGKNNLHTLWKTLPLKFIKFINRFTTLCPYYKEQWVKDGLPSCNIDVVTNMYDSSFKPLNHISSDKFRLLFVGNRAWWRDLNLFKQLSKNYESRIVGSGWGENVEYGDMPGIYAGSDVLVLPYRMPVPVSRCIIESMMCGVPVVTSGVDGFSPIIENNVSGVLVNSDMVGDWVDSVDALVSDECFYGKISSNAKVRVEQVCKPGVIVNQYVDMYQELMKC